MPKSNGYQSLHTTVIGPQGPAARDPGAHARDAPDRRVRRRRALDLQAPRRAAAAGLARPRRRCGRPRRPGGVHGLADGRDVRRRGLRLHAAGRGQGAARAARRRSTSPTPCTPTSATAAWAPRSTGASCRCTPSSPSGDIVEILTSNRERGPSRDWLTLVRTSRARNKIRQWFAHQQREDLEQKGRDSLAQAFRSNGLPQPEALLGAAAGAAHPRDGLQEGRRLLRRHRRRQGAGRPGRQQGAAAAQDDRGGRGAVARDAPPHARPRRLVGAVRRRRRRHDRSRRARAHGEVLHAGAGRSDHGLHLGRPRHHDPPRRLPQRARADALARALLPGRAGTARRASRSASRSRSTPGTARACWRTSAGRSPRTAATSSSTAASRRTRWQELVRRRGRRRARS